jgi:hypothetical protein
MVTYRYIGNDKIRVPGKVSSSQLTEVDWAYYTEPEKNSHFAMKEQVIQWKTNATVRTVPFSIRNIVDTEVKSIPIAHVHDHSLSIARLFSDI